MPPLLTRGETLRQVVRVLFRTPARRLHALHRRAIVREAADSPENFRRRLRATLPIVRRALVRLAPLARSGELERADEAYRRDRSPASIDVVARVVDEEYGGDGPPPVRRTKTPYLEPVDVASLAYGAWESPSRQ